MEKKISKLLISYPSLAYIVSDESDMKELIEGLKLGIKWVYLKNAKYWFNLDLLESIKVEYQDDKGC